MTFQVYEKVDDIDLMLGGVAEKNVRGGAVGATFACIIGLFLILDADLIYFLISGEQFKRIKFGDRFFYTHTGGDSQGIGRVAKSFVLKR